MKNIEEIRKMQLDSMKRDMEHKAMVFKHEQRYATLNQGINLIMAMHTANMLAFWSLEK